MAKTKKKEEVIDFTKPEKITEDQLKRLRSIVADINQVQHQIGVIESKKHSMIHGMSEHQTVLLALQEEFEKDYGTIDIDINSGAIKYENNDETNKKD